MMNEDLSVFFDDDEFATAASYQPAAGGDPSPITAIIDRDVEQVGEYGQVMEPRTEISFQKSEYADKPKRNDEITADTETFVVDGLISDDGAIVKVAVRG